MFYEKYLFADFFFSEGLAGISEQFVSPESSPEKYKLLKLIYVWTLKMLIANSFYK